MDARYFGKDRVELAEDAADLRVVIEHDASKRIIIGRPFVLFRSGRTREETIEFLRDDLESKLIARMPDTAILNWSTLRVYVTARPQNNMFHGGIRIDIIERTAA